MGKEPSFSCQQYTLLLSAFVGVFVFIFLMALTEVGLIASVFLAGLAAVILWGLISWLFCSDLPKLGEGPAAKAQGASAVAATGGAAVASASAAKPAAKASAASKSASTTDASATSAGSVAGGASSSAAGADAASSSAAQSSAAADGDYDGEGENAPMDVASSTAAGASSSKPAAAGSAVTQSAPLKGEEDLASRKGEWRYEGDGEAKAKPAKKAAAKKAAPKKAAVKKASEDAPAQPGKRPEGLTAARDGKADDLKRIKGIGPKLEKLCNTLGFFHFDQIAAWGAEEVAWVDQNLEGFKGRVTRDDWVNQAKLLAAGGETAFSKKVDEGDVY